VRANLEALNVSQLVPVAQNTEYDFQCYLSTDKLETGSAPAVEIVDAANGSVLAASAQAPSGSTPWNRVNLTFKTTDKTEAVLLKVVRVSCVNEQTLVCPIFGSVWYDDFSFKRRG
jgi:hypothetical protein